MNDRVPLIDSRLAEIQIERQRYSENEQILILLAQERLALINCYLITGESLID